MQSSAENLAAAVLAEYELGELVRVQPLQRGNPSTIKIITDQGGSYLLKPAYRASDIELQSQVAALLTAAGIRQPRLMPTAAGGLIASSGHVLLEWLPGSAAVDATNAQVEATMRHIADYHVALGRLPIGYRPDTSSLWVRVADPEFLIQALPGLLARYQLSDEAPGLALRYLTGHSQALSGLPQQLVHGDIGPDNVLMAGDVVVSLVDFTPHLDSVLFAASTALYWYHVYPAADAGQPELATRLAASLSAMGERRPWTDAELALWPAGLVREALRRLATPLELARESGTEPGPSVSPRLGAVRRVVQLLPGASPQLDSAR